MSSTYENAGVFKGKTAPPNAGQGDLFVDQTTNELRVHNGLRFATQSFSSLTSADGLTVGGSGAHISGGLFVTGGGVTDTMTVSGSLSSASLSTGNVVATAGVTVTGNSTITGTLGGVTELDLTAVTVGQTPLTMTVSGEGQPRLTINGSGMLIWGDGAGVGDTTLYRSTTDVLKTDDSLLVAGASLQITNQLDHNGTQLGFFNGAQATKGTVTGAKGSNAALGSLLTILASYGLITDSSSA